MLNRLLFLLCSLALVSGLRAQNCPAPAQPKEVVKTPIHDVSFSSRDEPLDPDEESAIAHIALHRVVRPDQVDQDVASIAEEAAERTRVALQNAGYFKAEVRSEATKLAGEDGQYRIAILILSSHAQYHLGDVNIVKATYFPTQQLRDLFPVQRGQIFSREKIAEGLEKLRILYNSQGFINMTAVPITQFDDDNGTADLTIDVDQGRQFRLRSVDVLGVDPQTKATLLAELSLKPGDVYSSETFMTWFRKFPSLFPNPNIEAIGKTLDEASGQVDALLDLRQNAQCSQAAVNAATPQNE